MKERMRLQREKLGFDRPGTMNSAQTLDKWLAATEPSDGSASVVRGVVEDMVKCARTQRNVEAIVTQGE